MGELYQARSKPRCRGDSRTTTFPELGASRLSPTAPHQCQKFTAASVMISIVPRAPSSIEILAMVLLSGASTTFT